jgi:AraC-like DNA-binding protein
VCGERRVQEALATATAVRRFAVRDPAAGEFVKTGWTHVVPGGIRALRVVPDAAIDVVFAGGRLWVAGPDTGPTLERLRPGIRVVGCQLRPGAARSVLGVPAWALRDERVELADLWGPATEALVESMVRAPTVAAAIGLLESALGDRVRDGRRRDQLAAAITDRVRAAGGAHPARSLAADLGVGERRLHRRCTDAFGYGPKVLARIVRLQRLLVRLGETPAPSLAVVAAECGYADQAHMGHDVSTLTGLTPGELRAGLSMVSDPDKTAAA